MKFLPSLILEVKTPTSEYVENLGLHHSLVLGFLVDETNLVPFLLVSNQYFLYVFSHCLPLVVVY